MEVHEILGKGHSEIVYGDAVEHDFKIHEISYNRESKYNISHKDSVLPSYYFADFLFLMRLL
jgi:GxxExxY protein